MCHQCGDFRAGAETYEKFQIHNINFLLQKRGRFALSAAIDTDVPIESDMCAVPESTPNIPSAPICNSMVTHMTTSFLTDCGSAPEINHNADADADAAEYCCDMETDEPVSYSVPRQFSVFVLSDDFV